MSKVKTENAEVASPSVPPVPITLDDWSTGVLVRHTPELCVGTGRECESTGLYPWKYAEERENMP